MASVNHKKRCVVVTGAAGQTGRIIIRKLLENKDSFFNIRGTVRSEKSKQDLLLAFPSLQVEIVDTVKGDFGSAFEGINILIITTSAVPKLQFSSLLAVACGKIVFQPRKPSFWFAEGQQPQQVDFIGQARQIAAAKAAGVEHIILVSSMAGTDPAHFLNTQMEGIVLWKRKAEEYLVNSGVPYTIIHPTGLLPSPGVSRTVRGGERQLIVSVNDEMLNNRKLLLPREDLAEVCINAISEPTALNRSFDLLAHPPGETTAEGSVYCGDLKTLLSTLAGRNCNYSSVSADRLLRERDAEVQAKGNNLSVILQAAAATAVVCSLVNFGLKRLR